MRKFQFFVALLLARILYFLLKITKLTSGTAILGLITLKICPNFIEICNNYINKAKVNITGTNGKTTTSGIITHLIKMSNSSVVNNSQGANMLNGIVNALVLQINPFKSIEYAVIETDEAFLKKVYTQFNSDYLLVTNLFEDQTDRFSSPIYTKNLIQEAINQKEYLRLILNADEPISASLSSNIEPIFFGVENVFDKTNKYSTVNLTEFKCPICNKNLNYSKGFYAQLGHYSCDCGYQRITPKYSADITLYEDHSIISLKNESYHIPLTGLFNAYNALGAIVLAKELCIESIKENIESFQVAFGRSEKRVFNGHNTIIQLIKNPAGTNEVLKTVNLDSNILIAINDNYADGRDISWIDQVDFEKLSASNKEIIVSGLRAESMKERLIKAGVKDVKTIKKIKEAVKYLGKSSNSDITILTTYTALLEIDKFKEIKKCY